MGNNNDETKLHINVTVEKLLEVTKSVGSAIEFLGVNNDGGC